MPSVTSASFTLLDRETVEALTAEHEAAPHLRILQKRLAQEITTMIHSREEYEKAVEASAILFGGSTSEALRKIDEGTLLQVFEGVPQFRIARAELGLPFVDLCAEKTQVFPSKGECRKMVQGGGVSLNKEKVADPARTVGEADLIAGQIPARTEGEEELLPRNRRVAWNTARSDAHGIPRAARLLRSWNARWATASRSIWN